MSLAEIGMLIVIGIGGGILTALVGGASLLTYPGLVAMGLAPLPAAIINLVALTPANIWAAWLDRRELPRPSLPLFLLIIVSISGGIAGAWLLLRTSPGVFTALVPLFLALSTLLFAYAGRLTHWIERRSVGAEAAAANRWQVVTLAMVPVAIYGGYFGAGAGVMLLAILMIVSDGDYRRANAIKNVVSGLNGLVASIVFVAQGAVAWTPVVVMTVGGLIGAVIGIRIVRLVAREIMRRAVIAISGLLTLMFAWKYWL